MNKFKNNLREFYLFISKTLMDRQEAYENISQQEHKSRDLIESLTDVAKSTEATNKTKELLQPVIDYVSSLSDITDESKKRFDRFIGSIDIKITNKDAVELLRMQREAREKLYEVVQYYKTLLHYIVKISSQLRDSDEPYYLVFSGWENKVCLPADADLTIKWSKGERLNNPFWIHLPEEYTTIEFQEEYNKKQEEFNNDPNSSYHYNPYNGIEIVYENNSSRESLETLKSE